MGEQEKEGDREAEGAGEEKKGEIAPAVIPSSQMEAEIRRLTESLEEKTKEAAENYDRFLRARADLENYKKRVGREKEDMIYFSHERLVKEILPVVDNLERAFDHINDESVPAIKEGIKLVLDDFLSVLKKFGVEQISALGEKFDPTKHEAVNQEETAEHEPGIVIKELHKCYYLNNRLLRPAMVVISKAPETALEMEEISEGDD